MSEPPRERPFILGLTGNIACGKSTVLRLLAARGAATIDADAVYHELIVPGAPLWRALRQRFGESIIGPDGQVDRRALGAIVFADPAQLAALDALTHPAVLAAIHERIAALPPETDVVVIDAVKLIESGSAAECDAVWVVVCEPAQQVERLMRRNGLGRAEAEQRVAAQPPLGPKLARADVVLDNSGDLASLEAQVVAAWAGIGKGGEIRS